MPTFQMRDRRIQETKTRHICSCGIGAAQIDVGQYLNNEIAKALVNDIMSTML